MTTTKEALEPCPLAHPVREGVNLWSSSAGQKWHIWCYDCGLQFEGRLNQPKAEVIKAWDSRVPAPIAPVVDRALYSELIHIAAELAARQRISLNMRRGYEPASQARRHSKNR